MNFAGKVVLITGASSGIGAATAKQFAKYGAKLALAGRNIDNLQKVSNDCKNTDYESIEKPLLLIGELTNENDTESILKKTIEHYGKLDILINNAGIIEMGSIETTDLSQYDRVMNTNVRSLYHLTYLAVPHLIKTKGNIVNVSSVNGMRSFPNCLAYCLSKAAVDQFTRCVALELAIKNIRVNCVNPGVTVTNLHKRGGMTNEQYEEFLKKTKDTHALGRPGTPEEVANTIVFLASDNASNITGVTLPCDGGRHAMCPR